MLVLAIGVDNSKFCISKGTAESKTPEEIYVVVQVRIWRASHEILIVLIRSIDHVDGVVFISPKFWEMLEPF